MFSPLKNREPALNCTNGQNLHVGEKRYPFCHHTKVLIIQSDLPTLLFHQWNNDLEYFLPHLQRKTALLTTASQFPSFFADGFCKKKKAEQNSFLPRIRKASSPSISEFAPTHFSRFSRHYPQRIIVSSLSNLLSEHKLEEEKEGGG